MENYFLLGLYLTAMLGFMGLAELCVYLYGKYRYKPTYKYWSAYNSN